jgi:predicted adenylyl cyclase CyaB
MRNLEAKFKLFDLAKARKQAEALKYEFKGILLQRDTFFRVNQGKLKLREEESGACLIFYGREDVKGLKLSNYEIVAVAEPEKLRTMMSEALGVLAVVKKTRTLLTRDNLRLHLDNVDGLGDFGEIEAVLGEGSSPENSRAVVEQLLSALDISRRKLIDASYYEMLRPLK